MEHDELDFILNKLPFDDVELSKIGEGAWHRVYKINRVGQEDLVIRVKKSYAYGESQPFNRVELVTEYEASKHFYHQANDCNYGICPTFFDYGIEDSFAYTLESYMGKGAPLETLTNSEAFVAGERLGHFYNCLYKTKPSIEGSGQLNWNGVSLEGKTHQNILQLWERDNDYYETVLHRFVQSSSIRTLILDRVMRLLNRRRRQPQSIALVNQDVTPENIIINQDKTLIIDPFPKLDFDLKFVGYFVFCYKFLLPAYADAPRFKKNGYDQLEVPLNQIADGFIKGYLNDEISLELLIDECILWTLQEAYEHYEALNEKLLSNKMRQQMGDTTLIKKRLERCIEELKRLCLAG